MMEQISKTELKKRIINLKEKQKIEFSFYIERNIEILRGRLKEK